MNFENQLNKTYKLLNILTKKWEQLNKIYQLGLFVQESHKQEMETFDMISYVNSLKKYIEANIDTNNLDKFNNLLLDAINFFEEHVEVKHNEK